MISFQSSIICTVKYNKSLVYDNIDRKENENFSKADFMSPFGYCLQSVPHKEELRIHYNIDYKCDIVADKK